MTSIKQRVFLLIGGFTLILSLVFSAITILTAYIVEDELIERLLDVEAQHIQSLYKQSGEVPELRHHFMQLYREKSSLPEEVKVVLAENPRVREIFTPTATHYHLTYIRLDKEQSLMLLAQVTPLLAVTNMSNRLFMLLVSVFVGALLIATYFAYRISRYTVLPITHLADELKRQQNAEQVALPKYRDEVGYLSQTLEENLNHLQQALSREKHFTRDVSHELRTPLTVIKNTLALSDNRELRVNDFQHIQKASQDIENTIEVLFMLARAESLNVESCNACAIIEGVLLNLHPQIEAKSFDVNIELDSGTQVQANPALLKLLVNNLILNALQHSDNQKMHISLKGACLRVSNALMHEKTDIAGDALFVPGVKGSDSSGIGQGLFLISRIVESMHWRLHLTQNNGEFSISIDMFSPS